LLATVVPYLKTKKKQHEKQENTRENRNQKEERENTKIKQENN